MRVELLQKNCINHLEVLGHKKLDRVVVEDTKYYMEDVLVMLDKPYYIGMTPWDGPYKYGPPLVANKVYNEATFEEFKTKGTLLRIASFDLYLRNQQT